MKPTLQALLVADHVYTDSTTGKKVIAGVFHRIWFARPKAVEILQEDGGRVEIKVPPGGMHAGSPFCYISMTELRGTQRITLRYVLLDEDKSIFSGEIEIKGATPLETVEVVLPLPRLPSQPAGTYALELLWNDEPLGSHRISVVEMPDNKNGGGTHEQRDN